MSFHIRRKDREITDKDKLNEILKTTKYMTIAFCMNNEPYLVSLSHGYDEKRSCLYFHCANEGKKLAYLAANRRIWGQVMQDYGVTDDCDYDYTSVHFAGTVSVIADLSEKQQALKVLVYQLSRTPEKLSKIKPEKLAKTTICRIDINYLTGKQHRQRNL
jgi:nitroimidazol reductase NimA-like FMN-containing flavoprotein (pyridoxamine 5'-phosphate oxidase superfamily)